MNIIKRLRDAREPYRTSKVYEEARAHNALIDAEAEIFRLSDALATIARMAEANRPRTDLETGNG